MPAEPAVVGITDVSRPVFLPLPEVTEHLHVVHYATDPRAGGYAAPPVTAIVVQNVLSGAQLTFAALTAAEAARVDAADLLTRFPEFERAALGTFTDYATTRPDAVWVHWHMRDAIFGFDGLKQRALVHRVRAHGISENHRFDLAHHLERRYGDEYAPEPRLWNALRRNFGAVPGLLDRDELATARATGNHAAVLRSLTEEVAGIARLFERARTDKFISGAGEPYNGTATGTTPAHEPGRALVLIKGNRTTSPGPDIRLNPDLLDPKRLTARHRAILEELLKGCALDRASCMPTPDIARAVDGPSAKVATFKHPIVELRDWGCVETITGNTGGVWLTEVGSAIAGITTKTARRTE